MIKSTGNTVDLGKNKIKSPNKRLNDKHAYLCNNMLALQMLQISSSLSLGAEELALEASFTPFSSLFLCLPLVRFHLVILSCGSRSFLKLTYCRFSPTLLISLSFLSLFCFSILSAPHLAFLGSHSHYATLAGTRPYISEYPVFTFSPLLGCVPLTPVTPQLFFPFTAQIHRLVESFFTQIMGPCRQAASLVN